MAEMIDFNRSFCVFTVTPTVDATGFKGISHSWRQKTICKAEIVKIGENSTEVISSYYFNEFCAGERVYDKDVIIYEYDRCGVSPFLFSTILNKTADGDFMQTIRFNIDFTKKVHRSGIYKPSNDDSTVYRPVTLMEKTRAYRELENVESIIDAIRHGDPLYGMSEFLLEDEHHIWRVFYPINYINYNKEHNLFQVDTGPVLFLKNSSRSMLENIRLSFIAYNNVKIDTEFLVYEHDQDITFDNPEASLDEILRQVVETRFYSKIYNRKCINTLFTI